MSKFLSDLNVRLVSEDPKRWQLTTPLLYQSDFARRDVVVPSGFETDFASVPRIPVAYWFCGNCGDEAAVVHDYLYRGGYLPREDCDTIFKEALLASGVASWRATMMWAGVRAFGAAYYKKHRRQ